MSGRAAKLAPLSFEPAGVLFDMDGLLFDSETIYREAFFELLEERQEWMAADRFVELVGLGWVETCKTLGEWFPAMNAAHFVEEWKASCRPESSRVPAMKPGVTELLDHLERLDIPAAIATGSQRSVVAAYLDHHGLTERFAAVIASEDCSAGKPDAEPFLRASHSLERGPQSCIALEDSVNGILSAHAAGCHAIFVPDLVEATDEVLRLAHGVAADLHEVRTALPSRA